MEHTYEVKTFRLFADNETERVYKFDTLIKAKKFIYKAQKNKYPMLVSLWCDNVKTWWTYVNN